MPEPSNIGQSRTTHLLEVSPQLLVRSVLELREEVRWYLSFTDEEIFKGVDLPEEEGEEGPQTPGPTNLPKAPCMPEPVPERRAPKFAGWEKVLHPSQPVVAAGDIPRPTRPQGQRWK